VYTPEELFQMKKPKTGSQRA